MHPSHHHRMPDESDLETEDDDGPEDPRRRENTATGAGITSCIRNRSLPMLFDRLSPILSSNDGSHETGGESLGADADSIMDESVPNDGGLSPSAGTPPHGSSASADFLALDSALSASLAIAARRIATEGHPTREDDKDDWLIPHLRLVFPSPELFTSSNDSQLTDRSPRRSLEGSTRTSDGDRSRSPTKRPAGRATEDAVSAMEKKIQTLRHAAGLREREVKALSHELTKREELIREMRENLSDPFSQVALDAYAVDMTDELLDLPPPPQTIISSQSADVHTEASELADSLVAHVVDGPPQFAKVDYTVRWRKFGLNKGGSRLLSQLTIRQARLVARDLSLRIPAAFTVEQARDALKELLDKDPASRAKVVGN